MNPAYPVCTVGYDPGKVAGTGSSLAAGVPRGWDCGARAPPCVDDSQCNGLSCVGYEEAPDGMGGIIILSLGACQCGENGVPSVACPDTINAIPMISNETVAPTRMRCVEARTDNFQGPQSAQVSAGDMFCVHTFDCAPPQLQFPDGTTTPETLPGACNVPGVYRLD